MELQAECTLPAAVNQTLVTGLAERSDPDQVDLGHNQVVHRAIALVDDLDDPFDGFHGRTSSSPPIVRSNSEAPRISQRRRVMENPRKSKGRMTLRRRPVAVVLLHQDLAAGGVFARRDRTEARPDRPLNGRLLTAG